MSDMEGRLELRFDLCVAHAHGMQGHIGEEGEGKNLPLDQHSCFDYIPENDPQSQHGFYAYSVNKKVAAICIGLQQESTIPDINHGFTICSSIDWDFFFCYFNQRSWLRLQSTLIAIRPIANRIMNSMFQLLLPWRFSITPIIIYTTPTVRFPTTMERVESLLTFQGSPLTRAMTSLEASILKQPPRKAPQKVLRTKQMKMVILKKQNTVKRVVTARQLQKREQILRLLNSSEDCLVLSSWGMLWQKQPRMQEPIMAPIQKAMGTVDLQELQFLVVRQVGIHMRNPQRMDLSRAIDCRYSLFSYLVIIFLLKAINSSNYVVYLLSCVSSMLSRVSFNYLWEWEQRGLSSIYRYTKKAADQHKVPAISIKISQRTRIIVISTPERIKPIMLPIAPLADHAPVMLPYLQTSKWWFMMVRRVGQAGNWQNPKISRLIPGSTSFKSRLFLTWSPSNRWLMGMQRQAMLEMLTETKKVRIRFFLVSNLNLRKKPMPRERQMAASKSPMQRCDCWQAALNSGLICAQPMRMEWRAAQAMKVRLKICHLLSGTFVVPIYYASFNDRVNEQNNRQEAAAEVGSEQPALRQLAACLRVILSG